MKKILISLCLTLFCAGSCFALSPGVRQLETLYFDEGRCMETWRRATALLEGAEPLTAEDAVAARIYAAFGGISVGNADPRIPEYLETARRDAEALGEAGRRWVGLADLGGCMYHSETNFQEATRCGNRAVDELEEACGEESLEVALTELYIGWAWLAAEEPQAAVARLENGRQLLEALDATESWLYPTVLSQLVLAGFYQHPSFDQYDHLNEVLEQLKAAGLEDKEPAVTPYGAAMVFFGYFGATTQDPELRESLLDAAIGMGQIIWTIMEGYEWPPSTQRATLVANVGDMFALKNDMAQCMEFYTYAKALYEELGARESVGYKQLMKNLEVYERRARKGTRR